MPSAHSVVPCIFQAFDKSFLNSEKVNSWGLHKRIQRHLIKSVLSPKNAQEYIFKSHSIVSSSTFFGLPTKYGLSIWGPSCSLYSSHTGVPESNQSFSYVRIQETSHSLSSPLDSPPITFPSFYPNTITTSLCPGNNFKFPFKCNFFT